MENFIEFEEYYLIEKNNEKKYKVIIGKNKNEIIIKILNYKICLNIKILSQLKKIIVNSTDEAYFFIINEFKENKVIIKEIINNKIIKLLFKINNNIEKEFEIDLLYKDDYKNNKILNNNNNKNVYETKIFVLENSKIIIDSYNLNNFHFK
jgi:hypothetical protein